MEIINNMHNWFDLASGNGPAIPTKIMRSVIDKGYAHIQDGKVLLTEKGKNYEQH